MSDGINRRGKENSSASTGVNRRQILRKAAATSSVGLLGLPASVETTTATHCGGTDDDNYSSEASKGTEYIGSSGCGELKLVSSTDVAHIETLYDDGMAWHQFYFATDAAAEWNLQDEKAHTITDNRFTIDASSVSGSIVDTCEPVTGVTPTDQSSQEVSQVFGTIAGIALSFVSSKIAYSVAALDTAMAFANVLDNTENSQSVHSWEHDRPGTGDVIPAKSKVQGHFEIGVPEGSSGYVDFIAETRTSSIYGEFCNDISATNVNQEKLYLWVTDNSAAVYKTDAYY